MEKTYHVDSNTLIYASQKPNGEIARWLEANRPCTSDIVKHECLERWDDINRPENADQKLYLERFFAEAKREGRLIETNWQEKGNSYEVRAQELQSYGIKERDAYIASVAEQKEQFLVTADNKKDFAPRLEKLNEQGNGNFKVQAYDYTNREQAFKEWNQQKTKTIDADQKTKNKTQSLAMKQHIKKSQIQTKQNTNYRKQ